jgi:tetratricopeptide (TPR) repeat protein
VAALPTPRPTLTNPDGIERSAYQWFTFALAQEAGGKTDEAVAAYRHALAADPGLAAAHTNLGTLAYEAGDAGAARASFDAALALGQSRFRPTTIWPQAQARRRHRRSKSLRGPTTQNRQAGHNDSVRPRLATIPVPSRGLFIKSLAPYKGTLHRQKGP